MHLFQQHGVNYDNNEENDVRSFMNVIDKELAKTKLMLKSANLLCKENYGRTELFTTTERRNKNAKNHMENVSRQLESTRYALLERIRNNRRMNKQKSLNEKIANGDGRNMLVLLKNIEDEFWDTVDDLKSWNRNRGKKQLSLQNINELLVKSNKNENEEYDNREKIKNEIVRSNDDYNSDNSICHTSSKNENSDSKSEISDNNTDKVCMYVLYLNEPNNMDNVKIYKSKMKMPQDEFEKIVSNDNSKKRLDKLWSSKEEVDLEEREKVLCNARLLVNEINEEEDDSNSSSLEHLSDSDTDLEDSKDNHDSRTLQNTLATSIDSGFNDSMLSNLSSPVINYLSSSTESVLSTIESELSFIETTEETLYECSNNSRLEFTNIDEKREIVSPDSFKNEKQLHSNLEVSDTTHPNTKIEEDNDIIDNEQIKDKSISHNKDENNIYLSDQELFRYENNANFSEISNRTITTNYNDDDENYSDRSKKNDSESEITITGSYSCSKKGINDKICSSKTINDSDKLDSISLSQESNKDNIFTMKTENIVKGSSANPDPMSFFNKILDSHPELESDKKYDENSNNRFDEVENEFIELEQAIKEATKHFDETIKQTEKTTFEIVNDNRDSNTSLSSTSKIITGRSTCSSDSLDLGAENIFSESTRSLLTDEVSLKNKEDKSSSKCTFKNDDTNSSLLTVDISPTNAKHNRVASFDSSTSPFTMEITRSFNVESINGGGVSNTESESEKENNDSRFSDVRGIENKLYDLTNIFDWVSDAEDLDEKESDLPIRKTLQADNEGNSDLPHQQLKKDNLKSIESGFDTYIPEKPPVVRKRTSVVAANSNCQSSLKTKQEDIDVLEKIYVSQIVDCAEGTEKREDIREIGKQYGIDIYKEDNRSDIEPEPKPSLSSQDKHDKKIEEILEKQKNRVENNKKNQLQSCTDKNVEKIHGSQLMDEVCFVVFFLLYFRMVLESRSRPGGLPVIQEEDSFDLLSEYGDEKKEEEDTQDDEDVTDDKESDTSSNGTAYYSAISGKTDPELERYLSTSCSLITPDTEIGDLGVSSPSKNRFNAVKSPIVTGDGEMCDIDMEEAFVSASTVFEYDFSKFESLHSESDESESQLDTATASNTVMNTVSQTPILDAAKEWLKSGFVMGETTEVDGLSDTMSDTSSSISITERIDQLLGESFDFFNSPIDSGNRMDKRIVTEIEINETDDELANYFDSALQTANQITGNTRTVPGDFRELDISNNIQTIENIDENKDVAHCNMVYNIDTVDKKPEENDFENLYLVQNSIPDGSSGTSSPENDEESSRITTPDSDQNDGDFFDISTPEEEEEYYALDNQEDNEDDNKTTDNVGEFNVQKVAQEMSQLARMLGRKVSEETSEGLSVIYEVEGEDSSESECRVNKVFELTEDTDESDRFDKVYGIEGIKEFSTDIGPHNTIVGNSSGFDRKYKDDVVDVRLTEFEKLYLVEKGNEFSEDASDMMYDTLDEESKASSVEGGGIATQSEKKRKFKRKYSNSSRRKKLLERKDSLELDRTESDISEYISEDGIYSDDSLDSAEELKDEVWVQGNTAPSDKTKTLNIEISNIDHNASGLVHINPSPIDSLNGEQLLDTFVTSTKPSPTDSISEEQVQKTFKQSNSPRVEIFSIDEEDSLNEDTARCSTSSNYDVMPTNVFRTSAREYKDAETKSRVNYWKQKVADISRQNNLSKR